MAYASAFSGGIFLTVALMHILPETVENFEGYYKSQNDSEEHFPWPYLITLLRFSFTYFFIFLY